MHVSQKDRISLEEDDKGLKKALPDSSSRCVQFFSSFPQFILHSFSCSSSVCILVLFHMLFITTCCSCSSVGPLLVLSLCFASVLDLCCMFIFFFKCSEKCSLILFSCRMKCPMILCNVHVLEFYVGCY